MKRYTYLIYILSLLICMVACQENDDLTDGYGYLQVVSVDVDKTIVPQTRGTSSKMALDIMKDDVVVKHVDDWTELQSESMVLPVGNYILKAYSADINIQEQGQGVSVRPFYMGESLVVIEKDKAITATVTCTLAHSMVSVSYTENFEKVFKTYESVISNKYGSVTLSSTEIRPAYFIVGEPLSMVLNLTNTEDKTFQYTKQITEKAEARYHYKVKFDVTNEGTGGFSFEIDETTNEYKISIEVPLTPTDEDPALSTAEANAWGQFAYLYGTYTPEEGTFEVGDDNEPVTFIYKKEGSTEWATVDAVLENGKYTAKTGKLDFNTTYEYRISRNLKIGNLQIFTTERFEEIPNLNLDTWSSQKEGLFVKRDCYYPNPLPVDDEQVGAYWATGNPGVVTLKDSNTTPVDDAVHGKAARLETIKITLAEAAAGNLFIGQFETVMSNPANSVKFGRPYSGARPVEMSFYYKYAPKAISRGEIPGDLTTDQAHIYIRLWDAQGEEIGYGEFIETGTVESYTKINIPVIYSDPIAKPAQITIVATSSRYGGEFSGSKVIGQVGFGSTLWVDEFELSYYKE